MTFAFLGLTKEKFRSIIEQRNAKKVVRQSEEALGSIGPTENPADYVSDLERKGRAKVIAGDVIGVAELEEISQTRTLDAETMRVLVQTLAKRTPTDPVFLDVLRLLCGGISGQRGTH